MAPITGKAAFIGKEQLGFSRYAVRRLARGKIKLVEGDTQLDPERARTVARTFHRNRSILAVVGPAGSQEVLAVAPLLLKAERLPFISASATRAPLTNGSIPNFFRVVPSDGVQRRSIASYMRRTLKPRHVFIVDDRTADSRALASGVQSSLRASGVTVTRASIGQKVTDLAALAAKVGSDIDIVFLPWQIAANAQLFGRELRARRKQAVIFGSDTLDSGDFRIAGSYVASFAPDIRAIAANAAFVECYGARFVSNFGPPAYVATQTAIAAIRKACADGAATRAEVQRNLRTTFLRRIVLGGDLRFTSNGDRQGAKYSIFKLGAGGRKTLVG